MRVTMLVKSDVCNDARVRREACALVAAGHDVTVVGEQEPRSAPPLDGVTVLWTRPPGAGDTAADLRRRAPGWVRWLGLPTRRRRAVRVFEARAAAVAREIPADVVHAHDLSSLAAATEVAAAQGADLVYDAHECWTGRRLEGRPEPVGRWLDARRERDLGGAAAGVVTVSPGIADWFAQHYGWQDVTVVRNTFPAHPAPDALPPVTSPPSGVLYAGRIDSKRDLDTAVTATSHGDRALVVVGSGEAGLRDELVAAGVDVRPLQPLDAVDAIYREVGLALVPLTDDQRNHELALPNKVFHAVRAGVPVVAADLPELRRLVTSHDIGELYTPGDAGSLRTAIDRAAARHDELRANVAAAAPALSWDHDRQVLVDLYAELEARA